MPATPDAVKGDPTLNQQLTQLQEKVAQLEATLAKNAPQQTTAGAMPGMGGLQVGRAADLQAVQDRQWPAWADLQAARVQQWPVWVDLQAVQGQQWPVWEDLQAVRVRQWPGWA